MFAVRVSLAGFEGTGKTPGKGENLRGKIRFHELQQHLHLSFWLLYGNYRKVTSRSTLGNGTYYKRTDAVGLQKGQT